MIPIAEEIGEYSTADNLRDILLEFEYHQMTPEEIAASELQSLIEAGESKSLSESITVQFSKYLYELEAKGLLWTDMEKDTTLKAERDELERRLDELEKQQQKDYDQDESDQTPGGSGYSTGTSNSGF